MKIKFVFAIALVWVLCLSQVTEAAGRCRLFRKVTKASTNCVKSVAQTTVAVAKAPIIFFQENKPVRTVINSIPTVQSRNCADGTCSLK